MFAEESVSTYIFLVDILNDMYRFFSRRGMYFVEAE